MDWKLFSRSPESKLIPYVWSRNSADAQSEALWAYDVTLDDGDYYLIAEVNRGSGDQGYIGLKRGSRDGALYFLGYEGGDPEPLGTSFRAAMEKYLPSKWGLR